MSDSKIIVKTTVSNSDQTAKVAAVLAPFLEVQDVLSLVGTLGAGKTEFARALIRALCGQELDVPSPTFNLLLTYDCAKGLIYHYDFYRLENPEEVWELDIEDAYHEGITVMEWSENIGDHLPDTALEISITIPDSGSDTGNDELREISISGDEDWQSRLAGIQGVI
ncbi:MAG: tRNA (adenosine(37)-N6)-threonylcarbamoyltransferase complex ATPase subunit type 1 TsaE [Sneathiella sp.]|nr:tRNA (adenosine(37)-N6)-threonylcarbamoyltransferase complex ATPase subunit type 1 TsaE [Sneathiella sp.]